jgi:PAS domain S-box-containing protein
MILEGSQTDFGTQILIYVPLSLIVASSFLSSPAVFLLVGLNVGAYFSIQAFGITLPDNVGPQSGMITIIGLVLMLLTNFRNNLEKIRITEIQAANRELEILSAGLEQRVAERTKALEISAEISRSLASILDPAQLAGTVVNQVRDAFNYYYAQVYLFDPANENLVLTAGTGEAGAIMLKRGHSIPKGRGLVGRAADTKKSILVSDTARDPNWLPNELLPNTKAEAVVPIIIGEKIMGVLDVQDNVTNDISPEDITLLESLAGQVAISLQNAQLFLQAQNFQNQFSLAVEGSNDGIWDWDLRTNQVYFSPRWKAMVGYEENELNNGFADFEALLHPEDHDAALAAVNEYLSGKSPAYDIEFRFHHKDGSYRWIRARGKALRDEKGAPYRMAGSHTDITQSREEQQNIAKRAQQQEALNLITQKIQSATTIESALQITARELGHALGQKPTLVTLEPTTQPDKIESAS